MLNGKSTDAVATLLEMGARRTVGFGVGERHAAVLAQAALQMAVPVRGGKCAIMG